ncbi:MAG: CDP-alcohol phosphatidyltransferase family protein [Propionibacteriaceae bacterium]|jgi:CDP-diacylglycerol--glycerol-3-phosphate 3-phosphatidyltransferase|nr:CDP-alcohol phosphatidyltransferase family protein [Propionibacteriaceae bacterium]
MEKPAAVGFKKHVPNIFSLTRIIVSALVLPFLVVGAWKVQIWIFPAVPVIWVSLWILLMATDKLDGTLARKLKAESEVGALLDTVGDALMLLAGVFCCIWGFADLTTGTALFYTGIILVILAEKVLAYFVTVKWHVFGNTLHSWPNKVFAATTCVVVLFWALIGDVPFWSLMIPLTLMTYAVIDEVIYTIRTEKYDVDFRGHGLQKYVTRAAAAAAAS